MLEEMIKRTSKKRANLTVWVSDSLGNHKGHSSSGEGELTYLPKAANLMNYHNIQTPSSTHQKHSHMSDLSVCMLPHSDSSHNHFYFDLLHLLDSVV